MKKLLFISIILSMTLFSCASKQVARSADLTPRFGAKAGVNFSDIKGPDVESFNGLTSFHIGAVAELPLSDTFSVQPELQYSAQGSEYDEGEGYGGKTKVNYLNVPVMGKYYLGEGFSVEAGPQVGLLVSAKEEDNFAGESEEYDIKDELKSIDIGLNFGLGYRLENGLNFGARYNLGLTDFNDSEQRDSGAEYKNSVIQVSVGYFFD